MHLTECIFNMFLDIYSNSATDSKMYIIASVDLTVKISRGFIYDTPNTPHTHIHTEDCKFTYQVAFVWYHNYSQYIYTCLAYTNGVFY